MIDIDINKTLHGASGDMRLHVKTHIKEHAFVALSGKSGSGKTTLLRILAGLETAEGSISVSGQSWLEGSKALSAQKRHIGFLFQDYALFANMSVLENLLYVSKDRVLAEHLLNLTELTSLGKRLPAQLSGGQQQRVALCRALMRRPKLLLMDEPLSALDPAMRSKLQHDILTLHKEFGTTTIMVSHDPSEIYRLSERVLVMEHGEIINDGSAKNVLMQPQGSQKFSLRGELLDIIKADAIYIGVVAIGTQIVEVVLDSTEAQTLQTGQEVVVSTKAFAPTIAPLH